MAITVTFTFDKDTVLRLEELTLLKRGMQSPDEEKVSKSSILRDLVAREFMAYRMAVSAETVASDPAVMLTAEERAKIGV